jgi:hypothetical protein
MHRMLPMLPTKVDARNVTYVTYRKKCLLLISVFFILNVLLDQPVFDRDLLPYRGQIGMAQCDLVDIRNVTYVTYILIRLCLDIS